MRGIQDLRQRIIQALADCGFHLNRAPDDRKDVPVDFRLVQLLLTAAGHPKIALGSFAPGVRVCPGVRLPRQPALHHPMRKLAFTGTGRHVDEAIWKRNFSSLTEWSDKVLSVLEDQASRGQVLKLTETDARTRFRRSPQRAEDKPNGVVAARVLFDGSHGIPVNRRTRLGDQESAPVAADLKRVMREKSLHDELTFALTADVSEAHRQIPIAPCDWHLLGCQVERGGPWAPLGLLRPHTAGHEQLQHLEGSRSTVQHTQPAPGTSSSRITSTWRRGDHSTVLLCWSSLCCAQ